MIIFTRFYFATRQIIFSVWYFHTNQLSDSNHCNIVFQSKGSAMTLKHLESTMIWHVSKLVAVEWGAAPSIAQSFELLSISLYIHPSVNVYFPPGVLKSQGYTLLFYYTRYQMSIYLISFKWIQIISLQIFFF